MTDWLDRDWLVVELRDTGIQAYSTIARETVRPAHHVRAPDELAAAKVVAGLTSRVGRYAVVPVSLIDLAANNNDLLAERPHR